MDTKDEGKLNIDFSTLIKEFCGSCVAKVNSKHSLYALIIIALGNTYKEMIEKIVFSILGIK